MILQKKTLEKLRDLINKETEYRSGPKLVEFFNDLGFNDTYGQGFPSRWIYTDEKLSKINGTPELDKCIKKLFAPVNFIGRFSDLNRFIENYNQYLAFDKWKVVRNEAEITFKKIEKIKFENYSSNGEIKEDEFLSREFKEISIDSLQLDGVITDSLKKRFEEIKKCLNAEAPLSVIFLSGSTLEGILLGIALKYPKEFNRAKSSPKDKEGKVKQFHNWTLSNFIDVAYEVGLLKEDVKKFSHALRDFRNYIHPYEQVSSGFNPDKHTAIICWQVLKAAIYQVTKNKLKPVSNNS
ncbi:MAG: hypothetical protein KAW92_01280 [Candidatus Cloacimonetes bacterium]|nr:hypothetical protein [Candidatus Cloacimonadota bacterium]MCK4357375.1 hypothetical protein [Candidatus Cloacimonadota bacterium]